MLLQKSKYIQDYITDQPYLSGLLTGLVAGLAVGFLFAPRSGRKLRKQIADTVGDRTKEAKYQWDRTRTQTKETVGAIKTNVGLAADKIEDEFNTYADKAANEAKKAEEAGQKAMNEAGRLADEAKSAVDKFKDTGRLS